MGDKDTYLAPDRQLIGPTNVHAWITLISALLLSLGYFEFLAPQPADLTAAQAKRWELNGGSDHSKAYGFVVKNIRDQSLMQEALNFQRQGRPLHQFMDHISQQRRTELEINVDLDVLRWEPEDSIDSFFRRGKLLYTEMQGHPGALREYSFLTRMLAKLPPQYLETAVNIASSKTTNGQQLDLESSITYLKQAEVQHKLLASRFGGSSSNVPASSSKSAKSGEAGPSRASGNVSGGDIAPDLGNNASAIAMFVSNAVKNEVRKSLKSFRGGQSGGQSERGRRGGRSGGGRGNFGAYRGGIQKGGRGYQSCQSTGYVRTCWKCGAYDHLPIHCPHDGHGHHGGPSHYHGGPSHNHAGSSHNHAGSSHKHPQSSQQQSHMSGQQPGGQKHLNHSMFTMNTHLPSVCITNHPGSLVGVNLSTITNAFDGLDPHAYLADSAATTHICNNPMHFSDFVPMPSNRWDSVMTGAGPLAVQGYGTVNVEDEHGTGYTMHHVMYVPASPVCLFSTIKLNQEGGEFRAAPDHAILITNNSILTTSRKYKGIYSLSLSSPLLPHEFHSVTQAPRSNVKTFVGATLENWHARFGHVGLQSLLQLIRSNCVTGLHLVGSIVDKVKCMACILGKYKRSPYPDQPPPNAPLELLHTDICGPLPPGLNKHKYFVTLRDKFTGYTMVRTIQEKSEAPAFIKHCIEFLEKNSSPQRHVKAIRFDKGGEYTSDALLSWLESKGINAQHTATECSQSNGTAERLNLTIMDRVRATLVDTNQPRLLWPWIVTHVVTALNYIPYSSRPNITPHQSLFNEVPDVSYLRPFGCKVVAHVPSQSTADKLCARGTEGRLVGYTAGSSHMYQVMLMMNPLPICECTLIPLCDVGGYKG